jgi:hypothetical protein
MVVNLRRLIVVTCGGIVSLGFFACSSSDTPPGIDTGTAGNKNPPTDFDSAGIGVVGVDAPVDVGPPVTLADAPVTGLCLTGVTACGASLAICGAAVPVVSSTAIPPVPAGGPITQGLYLVTTSIEYALVNGPTTASVQETFEVGPERVDGGVEAGVDAGDDDDGSVDDAASSDTGPLPVRYSYYEIDARSAGLATPPPQEGLLLTDGTAVASFQPYCGVSGNYVLSYTATPTTITFFTRDATTNDINTETVLTLQQQ